MTCFMTLTNATQLSQVSSSMQIDLRNAGRPWTTITMSSPTATKTVTGPAAGYLDAVVTHSTLTVM
jgi:hypothetical protein